MKQNPGKEYVMLRLEIHEYQYRATVDSTIAEPSGDVIQGFSNTGISRNGLCGNVFSLAIFGTSPLGGHGDWNVAFDTKFTENLEFSSKD